MFNFTLSNILHSNLINFIFMLCLFGGIFAFLNVPKMLKSSTNKIKEDIEKSHNEKEKSKSTLEETKEKFDKSDIEVNKIIDDANKISDDFMTKAKNDAQNLIGSIEKDYEKIYEREVLKIKKKMTLDLSKKSLQKTREKLIKMFENEELQEKYLNSTIEQLKEIDF